MSRRLPRWSVVAFLAASLAATSSARLSAGAENPDDIFGGSVSEEAAKPEPKKNRNAMLIVLRVLEKSARGVPAPPSANLVDDLPTVVIPLERDRPRGTESRNVGAAKQGSICGRGKTAIEDALKQPAELDLFETPLECAVNLIKENHRIEVEIDRKALDDAGTMSDVLITKSFQGIPLRSGLNLMLRDLDLAWMIRDEVLVITTRDAADKARYLETYDVSDLIGLGDEKGGPAAAGKRLAETIAAGMPTPKDDEAPKPGSIACSAFGATTILSATQNREGHDHIAQWLADARAKLAAKKPAAAKKKRAKPSAEAVILKALQKKISVDYFQVPLADVVLDLQEKLGISIQIDKKALDDVGIATDTVITKRLKDIPARSVLRLILHEIDLTYIIDNDVLLITTPEVSDAKLTTVVYDVADLVVCRNGKGELWDDYASLGDAIASTVRPATWDAAGGPGSVAGRALGGGKVLVVSQTKEVHEEIDDLLAKLRDVARKNPNAPPPRRDPPKPKPSPNDPFGFGGTRAS